MICLCERIDEWMNQSINSIKSWILILLSKIKNIFTYLFYLAIINSLYYFDKLLVNWNLLIYGMIGYFPYSFLFYLFFSAFLFLSIFHNRRLIWSLLFIYNVYLLLSTAVADGGEDSLYFKGIINKTILYLYAQSFNETM